MQELALELLGCNQRLALMLQRKHETPGYKKREKIILHIVIIMQVTPALGLLSQRMNITPGYRGSMSSLNMMLQGNHGTPETEVAEEEFET